MVSETKCNFDDFLPRSEDIGAVVVDRVHSRKVLQNEKRVSKEQAPSGLRVFKRLFDGLEESSGQIEDLLFHHGDLFKDVHVIGSEVPDPA